jgi:hypothetical protein
LGVEFTVGSEATQIDLLLNLPLFLGTEYQVYCQNTLFTFFSDHTSHVQDFYLDFGAGLYLVYPCAVQDTGQDTGPNKVQILYEDS